MDACIRRLVLGCVLLGSISPACASRPAPPPQPARAVAPPPLPPPVIPAAAAPPSPEAALLAKWSGPHGGVPPFSKVKVEAFKPAFEAAMNEHRREIAA